MRHGWHSSSRRGSKPIKSQQRRDLAANYRSYYSVSLAGLSKKKRLAAKGWNSHVANLARRILLHQRDTSGPLSGVRSDVRTRLLTGKYKSSILLEGLLPDREKIWKPVSKRLKQRVATQVVVKRFTFLEHPNEAIAALESIARAETECLQGMIHFTDDTCIDLGPWLALAVMRQDMLPAFVGGQIGNNLSLIIKALRLTEALNFSIARAPSSSEDLWVFPLRSRRRAGTSKSPTRFIDAQTNEEVPSELCDALNTWLETGSRVRLTQSGRRIVSKIAGEVLDNAERFSRPEFPNDGDWSITGFMRRDETNGRSHYICQLAFLSVGASIASTVVKCDAETRAEMEAYVQQHRLREPNHFHAEDHLRTIYALQDLVSGDPEAIANGRGGTGFNDIINLFGDLAAIGPKGQAAKLAIVSGWTCLHIGPTYCEVARPLPGEQFNIWLNAENQKALPPDRASVIELVHEFRGTLICMEFPLDDDYLTNVPDALA